MEASRFLINDMVTRTDKFRILADEVNLYLSEMDKERRRRDEEREARARCLDDEQLLRLLRQREREQNCTCIMQYLLLFAEGLPEDKKLRNDPANPYLQFQEFVRNEINLLLEKDVVDIILKEYKQLGLLNDASLLRYEAMIRRKHAEIREIFLLSCNESGNRFLEPILRSLQKLCQFWFQMRGDNPPVFRKNDIYIYNLCSRVLYTHFLKSVPSRPVMRIAAGL